MFLSDATSTRPYHLPFLYLRRAVSDILARIFGLGGLKASVTQFSGTMVAQTRLDIEAEHLRRFRWNFADWPDVTFPTVYLYISVYVYIYVYICLYICLYIYVCTHPDSPLVSDALPSCARLRDAVPAHYSPVQKTRAKLRVVCLSLSPDCICPAFTRLPLSLLRPVPPRFQSSLSLCLPLLVRRLLLVTPCYVSCPYPFLVHVNRLSLLELRLSRPPSLFHFVTHALLPPLAVLGWLLLARVWLREKILFD